MAAPPTDTVRLPQRDQVVGGRYRLTERLGSGGMGFVFQAEQVGVGNKVAVKFLDPEPSQDESRVKRFLQEATVALTVAHPGATQLLDVGRDEALRMLYLVFEYVEGEDLRTLLRREGRLTFAEAREIALKVAEVLAFAHGRGVVHRDVKPENLRLKRDLSGPHVKVLDFGIARLVQQQGVRLTAEGQIAGTPRYMAPEQVNDEAIDARTDGYALGLVIWEMLAGRAAYDGRNLAHVMWQQVNEPLTPLSAVLPGAPTDDVDAFLARACAKKADQRFRSMEALVFALKGLAPASWPLPPLQAGTLPRPPGAKGPTAEAVTAPELAKPEPLGDPPAPLELEPATDPERLALEPTVKPAISPSPRARGEGRGEGLRGDASQPLAAEAWKVAGPAEPSQKSKSPELAAKPAESSAKSKSSELSSQKLPAPLPSEELPPDLRSTVRTSSYVPPAPAKPPKPASADLLATVVGTDDLAPAKKPRRRWPFVLLLLLLCAAAAFAARYALTHR